MYFSFLFLNYTLILHINKYVHVEFFSSEIVKIFKLINWWLKYDMATRRSFLTPSLLEYLEQVGRTETIQATTWLKSTQKLRVLEYWENLLSLDLQCTLAGSIAIAVKKSYLIIIAGFYSSKHQTKVGCYDGRQEEKNSFQWTLSRRVIYRTSLWIWYIW